MARRLAQGPRLGGTCKTSWKFLVVPAAWRVILTYLWIRTPQTRSPPLAMMTLRYPSDWLAKAEDAVARLADRPWALFIVLLCVNTLSHPYGGITHDTRLYSVQVLNHVEAGAYADDLFFRYG